MTIEKKGKKFANLFALWFLTNPPNFDVPNFETFRCRQLNVIFVCGACLRALPNSVLRVYPQAPVFELATHAEATRETIEEWIIVKIISLHRRLKSSPIRHCLLVKIQILIMIIVICRWKGAHSWTQCE